MKLVAKTLLLFVASCFFSFLSGEFVARQFLPVRNVGPSFTEFDPTYGKHHKANLDCTRITPEFTIHFSTNSLGFRGPEPKRFPEQGILFLGDSFTEGYGVNEGEEFPALIRAAVSQKYGVDSIPVVNAGMGDLGNGRWLKFLRNEGQRYKPRLVVLQMTNNDFIDNVYEHLFSLDSSGALVECPPPRVGRLRAIQKFLEAMPGASYSYLFGGIKEALWSAYREPRFELEGHPGDLDRLTYSIIDTLLSYCQRENFPIIIVAVRFETSRLERLRQLTSKYGVQLLITPTIRQHPEFFYQTDGHWTAKGHEFVAMQILEAIAATNVLQR